MNRIWVIAVAAVLAASVGGYFGLNANAGAGQDCENWARDTNDRVNAARTLLYPLGRIDAYQGSAQQAASEMELILQEQENADVPDNAGNIHDDLIEAMTAGVEGLLGAGNIAPEVQITFAKSIIYNADVRLVSYIETC